MDASIRATDVGVFVDGLLAYKRLVRVRGGVRADALLYDVDDRLGNFIPAFRSSRTFRAFAGRRAGLRGVLAVRSRATRSRGPARRSPTVRAFAHPRRASSKKENALRSRR